VRIALLHSRYLSGDVSGENRVVADEAALLEAAGHDVATFTPSARIEAGSLALGRDAIWSATALKHVRRLIEEFRPHVVHVHSLYPALSPAVLRTRVPVVMTLHNARLLCLPATLLRDGKQCEVCIGKVPWRGVLHACYRGSRPASAAIAASLTMHRAARTFDRVALFLAVSEFVRAKHVAAGFDPDRIRVKPNFVPPAKRREGPGGSFVVVGRLTSEKGIDALLRSWGKAPLEIVGDGEERQALAQIAPQSVRFRGAVAASEVPDLLASARALLIPSRSEGLPRVVIEAFAAGVPVIASRVGGLPELVEHGVNGLLVDLGDDDAWRAAVERLADDAETIRLGRGALSTWQRCHSPESGLAQLELGYADAIRLGRAGQTGRRRQGSSGSP
jgi:glycosyltransferase involved in cell wall biosynthesis